MKSVNVTPSRCGFGELLLIDSLHRSLATRSVASVAVIVQVKDAAGATFYARYGFIAFPEQPLRLFLPLKTIARAKERRR